MELLSSISACNPLLPTKAAAPVTLRSPASVTLDDQAERLPDSKPSAKIRSDSVLVWVGVFVGVAVGPPGVGVLEGVGVLIGVGVMVGVGVGVLPDAVTHEELPESVNVWPAMG